MRALIGTTAALLLLMNGSAAWSQEAQGDKAKQTEASAPGARQPGEQTRALLPIANDATFTGKIAANAFKEGSPEMPSKGKVDCGWTAGNLWLTCRVTCKMGEGKKASTFEGMLTVGYDYLANEYRGTLADNTGAISFMKGTIDGNKLTLTAETPTMVNNRARKGRLTFDWTDPKAIKFTSEQSEDGGEFMPVETSTLKPTKAEKLPKPSV